MAKQKYAVKEFNTEHMAKALGKSLPISTKQSVEICNLLRNKKLQRAKTILNSVIEKKIPVPYKRYNRSIGHKAGIAVGRYPIKASKEILTILESAEANAQVKGLNTSSLVISHICAQKGTKQWHYGRQRGRRMKRTHIEVIVEERAEKKKEDKKVVEKPKAEEKSEEKKPAEPKKEVEKKEEVKPKAASEPKETAPTEKKQEPKKEEPKKEKPEAPKQEESK